MVPRKDWMKLGRQLSTLSPHSPQGPRPRF